MSGAERREALLVAAERSARPPHLLEKDIWVVWALRHLFTGAQAEHLVFKGGTSLSKAWGVIRRFSEDVDLTYDVRTIAPELTESGELVWPKTKSQRKRWADTIRGRLAELVATQLNPALTAALEAQGLPAVARIVDASILIDYEPITHGTGYVKPSVLLEFGARSTVEPSESKLIIAGIAERALHDRTLAKAVADNKSAFFAEKTLEGESIDYTVAVQGGLQLAPIDGARRALADDYSRMIDDGLLLDDAEPFEALLEQCRAIADRVNRAA
jgi:hypothetical protein